MSGIERTGYLHVVEDGKCAEHKCALILVCPECTGLFTKDPRIAVLEAALRQAEWQGPDQTCPVCGSRDDQGHMKTCEIGCALPTHK